MSCGNKAGKSRIQEIKNTIRSTYGYAAEWQYICHKKKMAFRVFTHSHTIKQIVTEAKPASEVEAF